MILTFGQYNTLVATRHCVTRSQLVSQMDFDRMLVNYYVTALLKAGLIDAATDAITSEIYYQLTESGLNCLDDYERHNPALVVRELAYQY